MRVKPRQARALVALGVALLAAGCATPVGVRRVDARTVHQRLTANVLSTGRPSSPTVQVLHRQNLFERFQRQPDAALAELHARLPAEGGEDTLFALAELSFVRAEQSGQRARFLAAAAYAYAFLFPDGRGEPPGTVDPRLRLAVDLYNRGITAGLASADSQDVVLEAGRYALPFGELELAVDPSDFLWGGFRFTRFVPAAELEVRGLRNRYRRRGIGAPLVAGLSPAEPAKPSAAARNRIPERVRVAVTAFVRFENPRQGIADGHLRAALELYAFDEASSVEVGGHRVPLEHEGTSAFAATLHESQMWQFERRGFRIGDLSPFANAPEDGLLMLHPYHRNRVPVVFVHGTASSPGRWAEMANELGNDPVLRKRCQLWFFFYNTGNPIVTSARELREALRAVVAELDPEGRDRTLRRMVLIGHSQGGLLVRMMVTDSGTRFWDNTSRVPLEELDLQPETRELLGSTLFFERLPFVQRVIFIATPHRGSFLAGRRLGRFASSLVSFPERMVDKLSEVFERNPDALYALSIDRIPSSVDNMTPSNPFIETLASLPMSEDVSAHSIIAVRGDGPAEEGNDGVVEFSSAHLEEAVSEQVVRSGHSTQSHPETIEEVRRILREHVDAH